MLAQLPTIIHLGELIVQISPMVYYYPDIIDLTNKREYLSLSDSEVLWDWLYVVEK